MGNDEMELLPCPFCGSDDIESEDARAPVCCECGATTGKSRDPAANMAAWNRRASTIERLSAIQQLPAKLDRRLGEAMLEAMWPSGEIIFADEFSGPEEQLSAGYAALRAALLHEGQG